MWVSPCLHLNHFERNGPNMDDYIIVTDSTCDITAQMADDLGVKVLPLSVNMGDITFKNYLDGRTMSFKDFYKKLAEGATPSTNAISIGDYLDALEPMLQEGRDILILSFSSGLSTTYNSSAMATRELSEKYPDRKIYCVDTLAASMGEGLLVWHAVQRKRKGDTIDAVRDWVEENKFRLCHWFTVDDLHHLKRGGRISAATAVVGSMLGIKPVLHVDNEGHLINVEKARGRQSSLLKLLSHMADTAIDPENQTVFISHSNCAKDAQWLAAKIKEKLGVRDIYINYIGPVIGSHTGIGTVALFFMGTER